MENKKRRKVIIDGNTERGRNKKTETGGNWIVRLNLFASSC
jgi:hypothetical protein